MRVLSLFSGIGGFDLGLERAGMEVVAQVEIDPYCNRVLAHHWPEVRRFGDVRNIGRHGGVDGLASSVGGSEFVGRWSPSDGVDIVCGGFPCQDVSVAGRRAGLDGERSGLWFEFQRILSELRPAYAIIENVPGLLSSNQGRDFAVILDGLGECGFGGIGWRIYDSQHFGVAQRRRRVFIVCGPTAGGVEQILSLCESCGRHPAPGRAAGKDTPGPLDGGAYGTGRRTEDDPNLVLAMPLMTHERHNGMDQTYIPELAFALAARNAKGVSLLESQDTFVTSIRTAQTSSNGWGVDESDTAYTLDGANGQAVAGASVRRLTPTECERLQGFPDGWTDIDNASDGPRYRTLGNAVTVPVIEYLGLRIMAVEGVQ